jgi:hypothetical protein
MAVIQWIMNAETALIFYERKAALGAVTENECAAILLEMAKEGLIKSVIATERSKEEVIQDLAKNYGSILHLKGDTNAE